jgi:thiol:disulfide interchange protein DsbD
MKKLLFLLFAFLVYTNGISQILDPVKWKSKTEKISETEFNLVLEGTIESGWHVYSQFTPDGGPIPLELKFAKSAGNYELVGKTKESKTRKEYNSVFEVDEIFFEKKVVLTQKVKIVNSKTRNIKLKIDYQACKEVCINLNKDFQFEIPVIASSAILPVKKDTVLVDSTSNKVTSETTKTEVETQESVPQEPI